MFTYLPCVLIRISIALLFMYGVINNLAMTILSTLIVLMFLWKYIKIGSNVWKNYLRTVLIYSLIIVVINVLPASLQVNKTALVGMLIIIDALLGQQSRFSAQLLSN
jgi:hypothetical protein